ncbi:MAG: hypothetical protein MJY53_02815 [Bacteroidales bacterium]|nr:hypothetical protein [Bacteroidales bacterium]
MEKVKFYYREQECADSFQKLGQVYNANTPELHPIIFTNDNDYKAAMSIFGICSKLYPEIRIYAFQLMSNHLHMIASGEEKNIHDFFEYFVSRLSKHFEGKIDFSGFTLKLFPVEDLQYFRNAVVYVNRNGFVVNDDVTPFSYPWGTSPYFFQPMAHKYAISAGKPVGNAMLRSLMHTKSADSFKDILTVDGYVSPLEFCEISTAEHIFRDARQYFHMISRNVEGYLNVARSIGETIFYNDTDLFSAAVKMSNEFYGSKELNSLSANQKLTLAKRLHFDYNAGEKQLHRLLKIDAEILKAILL